MQIVPSYPCVALQWVFLEQWILPWVDVSLLTLILSASPSLSLPLVRPLVLASVHYTPPLHLGAHHARLNH